MHQDVREERVERERRLIGGGERQLRDRHQHLVELRLLEVLQQHALGALLGDDLLVVRQVEGGGLHAVIRVAGRKHDVDDADRRVAAELGAAELRIDRQAILQVLQLAAEALELRRLVAVGERDERFERRLEVEPLVLVDLVGPDGRLDGRVELHPRDVARVVIVADEGVGALLQERLQGRLLGQLRGFAQQARHFGELALVLQRVRHRRQLALRRATNGREETGRGRALFALQRFHPGVDFLARRARGIEVTARRFRSDARHERPVFVELRPWSLVQHEIAEARAAELRVVHEQLQERGFVARRALPHEQRVDVARRFDQALKRGALLRRQIGDVDAHVDRREARFQGLELGGVGRRPIAGRRGGGASKRAERGNQGGRRTHRDLGFLHSDIRLGCLSV